MSYVTFQDKSPVTPLVCLLQNHQDDIQGNVPSPLASSQPTLLFQQLIHLSGWNLSLKV